MLSGAASQDIGRNQSRNCVVVLFFASKQTDIATGFAGLIDLPDACHVVPQTAVTSCSCEQLRTFDGQSLRDLIYLNYGII